VLESMINQLVAASFQRLAWSTWAGCRWFGAVECGCIEFCRIVSNAYGAVPGVVPKRGCNIPVG
jgi:hypothetical protein